ncbi:MULTISPECIES: DUF805 domain-containing protein [unclassified Pseudomonas]|uniref:DUF805 domain-containing protein n=1 Tax=unclassified Pseudomonas TaxID=196821 RepID=UPI0008714BEF|nr:MULTISPECIES: DUF805 domain-containing protein [unclassified Pseudomonas]SCW96122.1 Uncharacterized membrane protein YhaH, DUF805 family [Pseudomonas sp. NFACC05-1]SCZ34496.1 Uncharacterized membrane protein YhaH, DUF805 family [Pseudomonas sp. NFACC44-2]SDA59585.1 Uncharacterized membrane protein YhaH, DUF805 family [Pseudomonas sp. NFACC51]SEJ60742.1 Uncharacterized membrane protein YhaH, DUF805 family [Pseudomonas sp. NFACC07-1]SFH70238.1 Uncharacterized membrane protein YhaH, DUF805 fam
MSETRFNIVFDGGLMPGVDTTTAKLNLAELFKSDISAIERLFTGRKVALKSNLSQSEAQQYLEALNKSGIDARIEAEPVVQLNLGEVQEAPRQPSGRHPDSIVEPASPYAPPRAEVGEALAEYGTLKPFSFDGRIGRLRYLAWTMVLTLALLPLVGIGFWLATAWLLASDSVAGLIVGGLLAAVVVLAFAFVSIQFNVQRLHDLGWSGWLWLINLVPFVGSIFPFILIIAPGNTGANQYGPPPPRNTTAVKLLASLWLVMIVLIFMATFAGIFGALQEDYDSSSLSSYESSEYSNETSEEPAVEAAEPAPPSVDYEEEEEQ